MAATELDPLQANDLLPDALALDVREPYEYEAGHIEGSVHIPIGQIQTRWEELDKDRPLVVVCQIGQRSDLVAGFLRANGYDAVNLAGGLTAWAHSGLPLVTESAPGGIVDGYARDIEGNRLNPDESSV
jgi:rhodanese-related sulfurtransferase